MGKHDLHAGEAGKLGVTRAQYRDAVAEFDTLWAGRATAESRRRMDELLSIIDPVERAPRRRRMPPTSGTHQ